MDPKAPMGGCVEVPKTPPLPGEAVFAAAPKPPLGEPFEKAAKPAPEDPPKPGAVLDAAGADENRGELTPKLEGCPKAGDPVGWPKPGAPVVTCAPAGLPL